MNWKGNGDSKQGIQRSIVFVVIFFLQIFKIIFFCFVVAIMNLVHDGGRGYISPYLLTVNSILNIFHSFLKKDFQMLLAVNIRHVYHPHRALGQS